MKKQTKAWLKIQIYTKIAIILGRFVLKNGSIRSNLKINNPFRNLYIDAFWTSWELQDNYFLEFE